MTVQPINAKAILRTLPLTLSLSQIIELEKEADDEPKLFTRTNKKQYKKTTFLACQKSIKINYCLSVCPFLERGKCGVCYQIFNQTTQLSIKPGVSIRSEAHLITSFPFKKIATFHALSYLLF